MAWKNIKQRSFADDLVSVHSAVEELDDVHDLINWSRVEKHLSIYIQRYKEKKLGLR